MKRILRPLLICLLSGPSLAAGPLIGFGTGDLAALKNRAVTKPYALLWDDIRARAEMYCDRTNELYADPAKFSAGPGDGRSEAILGHWYGRNMTEWMEVLGFTYQLTGYDRYGKHGAALLQAALTDLPVTDPRMAKGFAGGRGDMMRGLAIGYDWLQGAMTEAQRKYWAYYSAEYVRQALKEAKADGMWWVPYHNFIGVTVGAAGCLALELRDYYPDEAEGWINDCTELIQTWLDKGFDEQGAYFEGTTYAVYGLSNAVLFADALGRSGGPNLLANAKLRHVPRFFAMSLLPGDSVFDARNDAEYAGFDDPCILRLAGANDDGLAKWLWQRCGVSDSPLGIAWANDVAPAAPPASGEWLFEHFKGRGLCVFRTGWGGDDLMFSVEAGPYYKTTHNQADKGQFTFYGLGFRWAIDSGYGNNREPEGKAQTLAHSCVLIDGKGQAPSGAGLGTNGKITACENKERCAYALADCTEAYQRNDAGQPGAGVTRALRHSLFVRPREGIPGYAVIFDDIDKDQERHVFSWLLHTSPSMEVTPDDAGAIIKPAGTSGTGYVTSGTGAIEDGACSMQMTINEKGRYWLWGRVRAAGTDRISSDSFFVQMDPKEAGGKPLDWHTKAARQWEWRPITTGLRYRPYSVELSPGWHTLQLTGREPDTQIDCVFLTTDRRAKPPFDATSKGILVEAEQGATVMPMRAVRAAPEGVLPRMRLAVHAAAATKTKLDRYEDHPRITVDTRAVQPEFMALLLPLPADMAEPEITFGRQKDAWALDIAWEGHTDKIRWPFDGERRPVLK